MTYTVKFSPSARKMAEIDAGILLTYKSIERFNITGTKFGDRLKARNGDILNGD